MTKNSRVYCPWHPTQLTRKRPLLVDDFLVLVKQKKFLCLKKMITMLNGLNTLGLASPHVKPLFDAIYELKDRTSEGGARVYLLLVKTKNFTPFMQNAKKNPMLMRSCFLMTSKFLKHWKTLKQFFPCQTRHTVGENGANHDNFKSRTPCQT
jgi:hypothetical protein